MNRVAKIASAAAALLFLAAPALANDAADTPEFFADGARFVRDAALCEQSDVGDENGIEGTLDITVHGIFGYELGCSFIRYLPVRDRDTGEAYSWVVTANCGDDSGISRPDNFTLIFNDDTGALTVQSQNEYVLGDMMAMMPGDNDPYRSASFLSGDYALCPTQ